jgi:Coenzyme PQQ synthesis protein D (PqqD)
MPEGQAGAAGMGEARQPRFRPTGDAVAKRVGDDVVLVQLRTNRIYTLNRTGARLWELLGEGHDLERARAQMLREFDVGEDQLRDEADALVEELVTRGMLEPDAGG